MSWHHVNRRPIEGHSVYVTGMDPDWYSMFSVSMPNGIVVGVYHDDAEVLMYKTGETMCLPLDAFQYYGGEHPSRMWSIEW